MAIPRQGHKKSTRMSFRLRHGSYSDQIRMEIRFKVVFGEINMSEQLGKNDVVKPPDQTFPNATEQERIDHVAEEVAEKGSHTEQEYDQEHPVFSK